MYEKADVLVGIYKTHNATKCVCLDVRLAMKKLEENE